MLFLCRKISDENMIGQSDDPRDAYRLKIKIGKKRCKSYAN